MNLHGRRRSDLVTGAVAIAVGVVLLILLWPTPVVPVEDPIGQHGAPRFLAGGLVVVGALLMWHRPGQAAEPAEQPGTPPEVESGETPPRWRALRGPMVAVVSIAYGLALPRLGFLMSTAVLGVVLMLLSGVRRWPSLVAIPVGVTVSLWFIFEVLLDVGLPGVLGG